jgi:hypothetical protein
MRICRSRIIQENNKDFKELSMINNDNWGEVLSQMKSCKSLNRECIILTHATGIQRSFTITMPYIMNLKKTLMPSGAG